MWPFNRKNRVRIISIYSPVTISAKRTADGRWYVKHTYLGLIFLDNWSENRHVNSVDALDWTAEAIKQRISKVRTVK